MIKSYFIVIIIKHYISSTMVSHSYFFDKYQQCDCLYFSISCNTSTCQLAPVIGQRSGYSHSTSVDRTVYDSVCLWFRGSIQSATNPASVTILPHTQWWHLVAVRRNTRSRKKLWVVLDRLVWCICLALWPLLWNRALPVTSIIQPFHNYSRPRTNYIWH